MKKSLAFVKEITLKKLKLDSKLNSHVLTFEAPKPNGLAKFLLKKEKDNH